MSSEALGVTVPPVLYGYWGGVVFVCIMVSRGPATVGGCASQVPGDAECWDPASSVQQKPRSISSPIPR